MKYKDIINFSIVKRLKNYLNDICILYNRIINPSNMKNRESDLYEVYTLFLSFLRPFKLHNIKYY